MKICKYCNNTMFGGGFETGRNSKSYTASYNCPKCKAVCDEKVEVHKGRPPKRKERWFNPETNEFEE